MMNSIERGDNPLEKFFFNNPPRLINKWSNYFEIYHRYFQNYIGKELVVLEIGVFKGGSLKMWKNYFGEKVKIYGIDINPDCKKFEEENIEIFIGSQSDRNFLRMVKSKIPPIDILIDDGGHTMNQQIISFEELYNHIKPNGTYLCEDLHTSYWLPFGGGYRRRGTFIEYSKSLIDYLNAEYTEQRCFRVNSFTNSTYSMHFYESVLVIEKRLRNKPVNLTSNNKPLSEEDNDKPTLTLKIRNKLLMILNMLLRYFRLPGFIWR